MDFSQDLLDFKKKFDRELAGFFAKTIKDIEKKDAVAAQLLLGAREIALAGGKRLRPYLACTAYQLLGGKDKKTMLRAALAVELLHLYFLIHDDIMDCSDMRHGAATLHIAYAKKKRKSLGSKDAEHFGNSMGIVGGDLLFSLANAVIADCALDSATKCRLLSYMQQATVTTIIGQIQDISIEHDPKVQEKAVMAMYENKTARYTFEWPLQMGALASGCADEKIAKIIREYAIAIGIAFQIQDDILGLFGKEKKTGKPVDSDIREGKKTVLVVKAFELADVGQKKTLKTLLGKKDITKIEADKFRDIIEIIGARAYAENVTNRQLAKAKKIAEKITKNSELRNFLLGLADFLEQREV